MEVPLRRRGLDLALKELTDEANAASTVPKYVILFTDGDPSTATDRSAAELSAQKLREKGIILYTVGLKLTTATETWLSQKIASEGCALSASTTAGLKDIFKTISSTITEDVAISKAEIRDVIDPRFQLVKDDGTVITDAMLADGKTIQLNNGGIVYLTKVNGKTVQAVKWTEQTIPNKNNGTWEQTVTVKAREEYIGGNNVPTNIAPDSSISTGYGDATLPQPKVNVKAELTVSNAEQTIFLGDTVPTEDAVLKQLFDADSKAAMGVTADDFTLTWYRDEACTDEITVEEMGQVKPADTTGFYLKVVYDPGEPSDESNRNTTEKVNGKDVVRIAGEKAGDRYQVIAVNEDEEIYPDKEYGVYTVYVVDGRVTVVKTISNPAEVRDTQGSPIFTFRLTRTYEEDGQTKTESFYRSMKADKDGETKVVFSHLPKGTYTAEELAVQQYELVSLTASADETGGFPCHMAEQKMEIGSDGRENRLQERDGLVQAVNKKTPDHHETSNDIIINQFAVKDGKVIITPVKTEAE
ncbi:VWA domain-containing protein [Oscillospiraceae bacterium NTUH-002-81]|nr:VWA domain-containing protein [Oscillospiraceae bacterium NTUH-002-81]